MRERRTITLRDWDDGFIVPVAQFIAEINGFIGSVPEHFRDRVMLEFDLFGGDYDTSKGELRLYYSRPETDDEMRERKQHEERRKSDQEAVERATLARLQAKYPGV